MRIIILDGKTLNPGDLSWDIFKELGEVQVYERTDPDMVVERCTGAQIVITNKALMSKSVMDALPDLRYIGVTATGYNVVDIEESKKRGIVVTNVPAYSTPSVAQMVFAHILHLTQHVKEHADSVKAGKWCKADDFCFWDYPLIELTGKTIGIVGFGRIGRSVAKIARAFDMNVIVAGRRTMTDLPNGVKQKDLENIFKQSDFISLNCPLTDKTMGFVDKKLISSMKKSAFLINTGRGQLINEHDLAEALNTDMIAGAGIDVLSTEPPSPDNPLLQAKNCYITPHNAWATRESRIRLMDTVYNNVKAFLSGNPENVVNK